MKPAVIVVAAISSVATPCLTSASERDAAREPLMQLADAASYYVQFATGIPGRYGPWVSWNRANEVANDFRNEGYSAQVFHSGDGYYIDVR